MPVSFEQAAPVQQYGAAVGLGQQYAMQQQAAMEDQRLRAQASMNNADITARSGAQDGDNAERRQMFEEGRQDRAAEQNAGTVGQMNMIDQRAGIEARQNVQQAQLRAWVGQQDITQQETARLERLKQGVASIQGMVQSNRLTQEDADYLIIKAKTGIDPLQQKLENTKAKAQQQQTEATIKHQGLVSDLQSGDTKKQADAQAALWQKMPDGSVQTFTPGKGWHELSAAPKADKGPDLQKIEMDARSHFQKAHMDAVREVTKWQGQKDPADTQKPLYPNLQNEAAFDANVNKLVEQSTGSKSADDFAQKRVASAGKALAPGGQGGNVSAPGGQNPLQTGVTPTGQTAKPGPKYSRDTPFDQLMPTQQRQVQDFRVKRAELMNRSDAHRPEVIGAIKALDAVQDMVEAVGGDFNALDADSKKKALELREKIGGLGAPAAPAPPPRKFGDASNHFRM